MSELVILKSLVIILGISAIVVFILHRIKIPSIVGFLLAGMMLGPHGLHLMEDVHAIQVLAEIGVILLLFTIGLEFSLSRFFKMKLEVFGIGGTQVVLTVAMTSFIANHWFGVSNPNQAVFIGFLVALSSTAIVMKILADKAEVDTSHGRISIGILIFQDLCIVPFMLFIPFLSGGGAVSELVLTSLKAVAIIAIVLLTAKWLMPFILHQIVRTRSRELFVISILISCFGIALITAEFGLSLALGAFLAGLVISESEYAHEAISTILPLRDSFNGLFFISVGMLMNISFFADNVIFILTLFSGIIILKFISGLFSMFLMRRPMRTAIQSSINLSQVGEFSFVLAVAGLSAGLITQDIYQSFLSAAVLTMLFTPFAIQLSPIISSKLSSHSLIKRLESAKAHAVHGSITQTKSDHVVIIGFGLNGQNIAKVLKEVHVPYSILEMNIATVKKMRKKGEPIFYGDGTRAEVLHRLGIETAKILVVVITDAASCRNIIRAARHANKELYIITRTRFAAEVDDLLALGADEVITEEFETSVEIFSRVLTQYQIPKNEIFNFVDMIREDGYRALRQTGTTARKPLFDKCTVLAKVDVELFAIGENSPVLGKSIGDLRFRTKTGATIVAIERQAQMHASPHLDFSFEVGDILYLTGTREIINKAIVYLTEGTI